MTDGKPFFEIPMKNKEETMDNQKIVNLLNDSNNEYSKFATRKWYILNDQNNGQYGRGDEMIQSLTLKQKSLNQIFVITQIHIFL